MRRTAVSTLLLLTLALVGCGGGGGAGASSAKGVPFSIAWASRSRGIAGPSSALSAVATLVGAGPEGGDLTTIVNRKDMPGAYTSHDSFAYRPKAGTYTMTIRFYAEPTGGGTVVAEGTQNVTLKSDGSGIGSVATENAIAQVEVLAKQVVLSGTHVQLGFAARDAQGALVAVSPGSAVWSIAGDGANLSLSKDGQAVATGTGLTSVKVSLDGLSSPTVPVFATNRSITVVIDPDQSMPLDDLRPLTLTVKDDQGSTVDVPREFVRWSMLDGSPQVGISDEGVPYLTDQPLGPGGTFAIAKIGSVASEPTPFQLTAATPPTLTIDPGQSIWLGDTKQLTFTAKDKNGNVVPVPYWEEEWTLESGADVVNVLGGFAVQALRPGTATLRVHVGSLVSGPGTVTVLPPDSIVLEAVTPEPLGQDRFAGQLTFIARNAQGAIVQLPEGDASWEVVGDPRDFRLESNGRYSSGTPGTYSVRVRAHGVYSEPVTVTILPAS